MTIQWSGLQELQAGNKKVPAKVVLPEEPNGVRFVLYPINPSTTWVVYDYQEQIHHYIYGGHDWEGAQAKAEKRIESILRPSPGTP